MIKPKVDIILNGETEIFPLETRRKQGCPHLPILFNILLETLAREIKQKIEIKVVLIPLFAGDKSCFLRY